MPSFHNKAIHIDFCSDAQHRTTVIQQCQSNAPNLGLSSHTSSLAQKCAPLVTTSLPTNTNHRVLGARGGGGRGLLGFGHQLPPPPHPPLTDGRRPPKGGEEVAIKQRIQSSHIPPCHRHMVIATNFSSLFDLLHCSIPQTGAECCLEFAAGSGHRMFLGLSGSPLPPPTVPRFRDHKNSGPRKHQKERFNAHPALGQSRACARAAQKSKFSKLIFLIP